MIRNIFPVLCVDDVDAARDFYVDVLDLTVTFECGWYTALTVDGDVTRQVAIVQAGHASVPEGFNEAARGSLVTVDVDDVDQVHERALAAGLEAVVPLRDEAFGQRHFMLRDPNGTLLDVVQWIRPSREFLREVAAWRRTHR